MDSSYPVCRESSILCRMCKKGEGFQETQFNGFLGMDSRKEKKNEEIIYFYPQQIVGGKILFFIGA
jgi:hypothetical protein